MYSLIEMRTKWLSILLFKEIEVEQHYGGLLIRVILLSVLFLIWDL